MLNFSNATLLTFYFPGAMLHNVVPNFHSHLEAVVQRCSVSFGNFTKSSGKRFPVHRCFLGNFAKFLRTPFF